MKPTRIFALLLAALLLLSLCSCGKKSASLEGPTESIDGDEGNECFFGSTEEIRGLYESLAEGDEGVKKYVADRDTEHEYYDDLSLVDSEAKARYLLLDIIDLPIAVFPEESFPLTHYYRDDIGKQPQVEGNIDNSGSRDFLIRYLLDESWHFREERYFSVHVSYHQPQELLEIKENNGGHSTPVETLEIDGYRMNIYVTQDSRDAFSVSGTILLDGSLTTITVPVEDTDSGSSGVKQAVAKLHAVRITTLRDLLGIGDPKK